MATTKSRNFLGSLVNSKVRYRRQYPDNVISRQSRSMVRFDKFCHAVLLREVLRYEVQVRALE